MTLTFSPLGAMSRPTHVQTITIKGQSVRKIKWIQTDRQTDIRMPKGNSSLFIARQHKLMSVCYCTLTFNFHLSAVCRLSLPSLYERYREDRIHTKTGGWLPVLTWLPRRTCVPCLPLYAVHQTFRRTVLFARTVSCRSVVFIFRVMSAALPQAFYRWLSSRYYVLHLV